MTRQVLQISRAVTELVLQFKDAEPEHIKGELGIDVSKWQGEVNWDAMITAGVGFAGIRATMGASGRDEQFKRNWAEARRVGIQRMAYHYFVNNMAGQPQIDNFLGMVGNDMGELPMVLDVELAGGQVITNRNTNTNEILLWLGECEKRTGTRPMIYTNKSAWDACTNVPAWSSSYKLWLAQYNNRPAPTVSPPWVSCQIWQYSNKGSIGGTSPLDLNRYGPYP
jgi:lysozyme